MSQPALHPSLLSVPSWHTVVGIPIEQLDTVEQYVFEICNESIEPPLHFQLFRIELPDAAGVLRPLLKVEIPRSLFLHRSPGGYFHRQGSSKRRMSTEFLLRLGQQRSQARLYRFEEQAVPGTTFADLEPDRRRRFSRPDAEDVSTFKKMKFVANDETGRTRATVAGILMCSSNPEQWLPGAFIQAVRYRGVRQDSNYQLDAQAITGPVDEQIAAAMAFVRRNMKVAARKAPGRVEVPQFSLRAVFEAVAGRGHRVSRSPTPLPRRGTDPCCRARDGDPRRAGPAIADGASNADCAGKASYSRGRRGRGASSRTGRGMDLRLHPCSVAPVEGHEKCRPNRPTPAESCRVAPGDCSPEALTRTGLGGFHHPALPLMWLMAMRPRFARESEARAEDIVPTTQRTSARGPRPFECLVT